MKEQLWDKDILDSIWNERMTLCYKMLLIRESIDGASSDGRIQLRALADRFQRFFRQRKDDGKAEDNPNRFKHGEKVLSERSIEEWERNILEEPVAHLKGLPLKHMNDHLQWDANYWGHWSKGFKAAIKKTAEVRLIEYFERNVPGGF